MEMHLDVLLIFYGQLPHVSNCFALSLLHKIFQIYLYPINFLRQMMNIKNTSQLLLNVNLIYSINQSKVSNSNGRVKSKLSQFSRNRLLSKTFLRNNLSSSVLHTIHSFHRFFFIFQCLNIGFICIICMISNRFRPCSMSISV